MELAVIIPVYNRARLVGCAIDSCLAEFRAAGVRGEIIVIDDCSTDGTRDALAAYGSQIEVIALPKNQGQCNARNVGIAGCRAEYIKFLDSDDVLAEESLGREFTAARAAKAPADIVISGWGGVKMDGEGRTVAGSQVVWPVPRMAPLPDALLLGRAVPTSAALYRQEYIAGLKWDTSLRKLDDWDWFCEAAQRRGHIVEVDGVSYWMREHSGPRATSNSTMLLNAHEFLVILGKLEAHLRERSELTPERRMRLAQYYYKELRVLCLHDRAAFKQTARHIRELDPRFQPRDEERRLSMRLMARLLGFERATTLFTRVKRAAKIGSRLRRQRV